MSYTIYENLNVKGVSVVVPQNVEYNREEATKLNVDDIDKFIETVGVEKRHVAIKGQTSSDLCFVAAKRLIEHLEIDVKSIGAVLFVTQTPDYIQPSSACVLHGRLGMAKDSLAFDINLGCSGFVYGLSLAASLINGMGLNRVLLLVGDILRKNPEVDKKDTLLFGDAGTATIIEKGTEKIESVLYTNGCGYTNLIIPGGGTRKPYSDGEDFWQITKPEMDGEAVMSFTITEVPKAFKELFANNGKTIDDYDYCLLHQANKQMVNYIARKIKLPKEKVHLSMDKYGNTNGSSVLVALSEVANRENVKNKVSCVAAGYGIGLSWGVVTFNVDTKNILPIYSTDEVFEEAYYGQI